MEHDLVLDSTPLRTWYWTLKSLERVSSMVVLNVSMDLPEWWVSNGLTFPCCHIDGQCSVIAVCNPPLSGEWLLVLAGEVRYLGENSLLQGQL